MYQAVLEFDWFSIFKSRPSCDQRENYVIFISIYMYIKETQLTVKRTRVSNTCLPRIKFYLRYSIMQDQHTLYPYVGFLTLKSDFCQIGLFEVSFGVIGFSVLNRETPDEIGRVGKHVTVSGLIPFVLFPLLTP